MATGLEEFGTFLKEHSPGGRPFEARPYYEPETDSIIFYARKERSKEKRINRYLTVFVSVKDESLVGIEIKGVKSVLIPAIEGLGKVALVNPIQVKDEDGGSLDLRVFVHCASFPSVDSPVDYAQLHEISRGVTFRKDELCGT